MLASSVSQRGTAARSGMMIRARPAASLSHRGLLRWVVVTRASWGSCSSGLPALAAMTARGTLET